MARYVVDTHALIWFLAKNPRLGSSARQVLSDPANELILPAIALAEALWIVDSRALGVTTTQVIQAVDADSRIAVYPLTRAIVEQASRLSAVGEMHDRQIVATAMHLSTAEEPVSLITRDENIVGSGAIATVW